LAAPQPGPPSGSEPAGRQIENGERPTEPSDLDHHRDAISSDDEGVSETEEATIGIVVGFERQAKELRFRR
jgi:hypothetical protein